jgi:putative transposase
MLAEKGKPVGRKVLDEVATLASPETIMRWYRRLVAAKYDGGARSPKGDHGKRKDATTQLLTMAKENPSWGYTRLRGALKNVGLEVSRSTIARVLKDHGIEPAPRPGRTMSWSTFLAAHWEAIAAADFFIVEVLTSRGLVLDGQSGMAGTLAGSGYGRRGARSENPNTARVAVAP